MNKARLIKIAKRMFPIIIFIPGIWVWTSYRIMFDGHVYDADTGKPIEGAQIFISIEYGGGGSILPNSRFKKSKYIETDKHGYFRFDRIYIPLWVKGDVREHTRFIIYKKGYIAFTVDGGFKKTYYDTKLGRRMKIYLKKWEFGDSAEAHSEHMYFIDSNIYASGCINVKTEPEQFSERKKFCEEIYDEIKIANPYYK